MVTEKIARLNDDGTPPVEKSNFRPQLIATKHTAIVHGHSTADAIFTAIRERTFIFGVLHTVFSDRIRSTNVHAAEFALPRGIK